MTANVRDGIAQDPTVEGGRTPGAAAGGVDELAAGSAAGEYVVERRLGGGAMGDVYAGRHPVIDKKVAIKVLKRELAARADSAERFLREARAVNQIDHANVVDVFALGRLDDGRLYLVMDLLDGESLRARLARGPMAPDVTLAVLAQIAQALDVAHARGVIHRDLKPDNIMLTGPAARPVAHVLDFGIAKLVADAAGERALETLTGQGAWLGTPAYMAPEQWSADGATAASDRYALGIVAYEMLTGKPPFAATTLPGMMEQHFRGDVPSVTSSGA
ncbi:MAG: serine/threonine protein kinase, partial [Deltaproteobacteria bacterium]|nr:serine/threonine protein kinase [Kofleriaceae bacterium]